MSRYDITTTCPICGDFVKWENGKTNSKLVYIKTRRKSVLVIHKTCIEKEKEIANEHIKSKENRSKGKQGEN